MSCAQIRDVTSPKLVQSVAFQESTSDTRTFDTTKSIAFSESDITTITPLPISEKLAPSKHNPLTSVTGTKNETSHSARVLAPKIEKVSITPGTESKVDSRPHDMESDQMILPLSKSIDEQENEASRQDVKHDVAGSVDEGEVSFVNFHSNGTDSATAQDPKIAKISNVPGQESKVESLPRDVESDQNILTLPPLSKSDGMRRSEASGQSSSTGEAINDDVAKGLEEDDDVGGFSSTDSSVKGADLHQNVVSVRSSVESQKIELSGPNMSLNQAITNDLGKFADNEGEMSFADSNVRIVNSDRLIWTVLSTSIELQESETSGQSTQESELSAQSILANHDVAMFADGETVLSHADSNVIVSNWDRTILTILSTSIELQESEASGQSISAGVATNEYGTKCADNQAALSFADHHIKVAHSDQSTQENETPGQPTSDLAADSQVSVSVLPTSDDMQDREAFEESMSVDVAIKDKTVHNERAMALSDSRINVADLDELILTTLSTSGEVWKSEASRQSMLLYGMIKDDVAQIGGRETLSFADSNDDKLQKIKALTSSMLLHGTIAGDVTESADSEILSFADFIANQLQESEALTQNMSAHEAIKDCLAKLAERKLLSADFHVKGDDSEQKTSQTVLSTPVEMQESEALGQMAVGTATKDDGANNKRTIVDALTSVEDSDEMILAARSTPGEVRESEGSIQSLKDGITKSAGSLKTLSSEDYNNACGLQDRKVSTQSTLASERNMFSVGVIENNVAKSAVDETRLVIADSSGRIQETDKSRQKMFEAKTIKDDTIRDAHIVSESRVEVADSHQAILTVLPTSAEMQQSNTSAPVGVMEGDVTESYDDEMKRKFANSCVVISDSDQTILTVLSASVEMQDASGPRKLAVVAIQDGVADNGVKLAPADPHVKATDSDETILTVLSSGEMQDSAALRESISTVAIEDNVTKDVDSKMVVALEVSRTQVVDSDGMILTTLSRSSEVQEREASKKCAAMDEAIKDSFTKTVDSESTWSFVDSHVDELQETDASIRSISVYYSVKDSVTKSTEMTVANSRAGSDQTILTVLMQESDTSRKNIWAIEATKDDVARNVDIEMKLANIDSRSQVERQESEESVKSMSLYNGANDGVTRSTKRTASFAYFQVKDAGSDQTILTVPSSSVEMQESDTSRPNVVAIEATEEDIARNVDVEMKLAHTDSSSEVPDSNHAISIPPVLYTSATMQEKDPQRANALAVTINNNAKEFDDKMKLTFTDSRDEVTDSDQMIFTVLPTADEIQNASRPKMLAVEASEKVVTTNADNERKSKCIDSHVKVADWDQTVELQENIVSGKGTSIVEAINGKINNEEDMERTFSFVDSDVKRTGFDQTIQTALLSTAMELQGSGQSMPPVKVVMEGKKITGRDSTLSFGESQVTVADYDQLVHPVCSTLVEMRESDTCARALEAVRVDVVGAMRDERTLSSMDSIGAKTSMFEDSLNLSGISASASKRYDEPKNCACETRLNDTSFDTASSECRKESDQMDKHLLGSEASARIEPSNPMDPVSEGSMNRWRDIVQIESERNERPMQIEMVSVEACQHKTSQSRLLSEMPKSLPIEQMITSAKLRAYYKSEMDRLFGTTNKRVTKTSLPNCNELVVNFSKEAPQPEACNADSLLCSASDSSLEHLVSTKQPNSTSHGETDSCNTSMVSCSNSKQEEEQSRVSSMTDISFSDTNDTVNVVSGRTLQPTSCNRTAICLCIKDEGTEVVEVILAETCAKTMDLKNTDEGLNVEDDQIKQIESEETMPPQKTNSNIECRSMGWLSDEHIDPTKPSTTLLTSQSQSLSTNKVVVEGGTRMVSLVSSVSHTSLDRRNFHQFLSRENDANEYNLGLFAIFSRLCRLYIRRHLPAFIPESLLVRIKIPYTTVCGGTSHEQEEEYEELESYAAVYGESSHEQEDYYDEQEVYIVCGENLHAEEELYAEEEPCVTVCGRTTHVQEEEHEAQEPCGAVCDAISNAEEEYCEGQEPTQEACVHVCGAISHAQEEEYERTESWSSLMESNSDDDNDDDSDGSGNSFAAFVATSDAQEAEYGEQE